MQASARFTWPQLLKYGAVSLLDAAGIALVGAQLKPLGWGLLAAAAVAAIGTSRDFRRLFWLLCVCIAVLGLAPISTDLTYGHFFLMGGIILALVTAPFYLVHHHWHDVSLRLVHHHRAPWGWRQYAYIGLAAVLSYLVMPPLMIGTGSYLNWTVSPEPARLFELFMGTNILGIWDELFFIVTVLGILRHYLPFRWANLGQAVLFTSFLYELGFRSWCAAFVFGFALLQGIIFRRTQSIFFILAIHLTVDFLLYLTLVYAHFPEWLPIFVTG